MRTPGFVLGLSALASACFLLLTFAGIGPSARLAHHARLGVLKDSEAIQKDHLSFLRYYASVQGDAYVYYQAGLRMAGLPLPALGSPLSRMLGHEDDVPDAAPVAAPQLPYRDFPSVQPPLAVLYFGALARLFPSFDAFFLALRLINLAALLAAVALCYPLAHRLWAVCRLDYAAWAGLLLAALGPRWLCFFVALPALGVALAVWACARRGWVLAGSAIAVATLLKVYPAFLAPVVLLYAFRAARWSGLLRVAAAGAATTLLAVSPWLLHAPQSLAAGVLAQAGRKYLDFASFFGGILMILHQFGLAAYTPSSELETPTILSAASAVLARLALPLMLAATVALWGLLALALWRRGPRDQTPALLSFAAGLLGIHMTILTTSVVFSPHYPLWLLPALLLFAGSRAPLLPLGVALGLLIQIQNPFLQPSARRSGSWPMTGLFIVRNAVMLTILWFAVRALLPPPQPREAPSATALPNAPAAPPSGNLC